MKKKKIVKKTVDIECIMILYIECFIEVAFEALSISRFLRP